MRFTLFVTALVAVLAVPAMADELDLGAFHPAGAISFTAGLTEPHNSYGLALGGHVGLARFGRVRFPVVGAEAGFAYICDPFADTIVPGAHDPCGNRHAGMLQLKGGAELIINRTRVGNFSTGIISVEETSLFVTPTYAVAGPLRGNWGVSFGVARRWGKRHSDW